MSGFLNGLAQGFSGLNESLDRRDQLNLRRQTEARNFQLEQQRVTGDTIKQFADAIQSTPDDQLPGRVKLLFSQIENLTGQKVDPAVSSIILKDPANAAKSMMELYGERPFDQKQLGTVLANPAMFAGIMDSMNRRKQAQEAASSFAQGFGAPQAPSYSNIGVNPGVAPPAPSQPSRLPGATDLSGMQARLEQINQSIAKIGGMPGLPPEEQKNRIAALQAQADAIDKRMTSAFENATKLALMRMGVSDASQATPAQLQAAQRDVEMHLGFAKQSEKAGEVAATPVPLEAAGQLGLPYGTTMGQIQQQNAAATRGAMGGSMSAGPLPSNVSPALLDSLRNVESSGDRFAVNKTTGAMGPYQFMPATVADMNRQGISFNPFDEQQSRAAAGQYLSKLLQQNGGDMRKALAQYGGFVSKDPSAYVNKVLGGMQQGQPSGNSLIPPTPAQTTQQGELAKGAVKVYSEIQNAGRQAAKDGAQMQQLGSYLDKVDSGQLAGTTLALQRFGKAMFGLDIPASANYAEAAKAITVKMIGQIRQQAGGSGSTSDYEDRLYQAGLANIDKLPGTNQILVRAALNEHKRTQEIAKEVAAYRKQSPLMDEGEIQNIVSKYVADHPIFSSADADKLLASAPATSPKAPAIKSKAIPKGWGVEELKQ